ncbi:hypothetical protein WA026_023704 [Henosepilachna vigintioctopunctata]|uniref:Uncharacterized protein n=1 Tax=Henosepilachna vigintioctopunctata TaxID=420089 RepID=A0AAW1USH8_9CUCU
MLQCIQCWITTEIFLTWFKKFIRFSGATPTNHVLLLLDEHQQRVTEAEGPQYEVVPSVPLITVVTTLSSTATTSHPGPVTTKPEVTTESCTPVRIDFIIECTEQFTPDVTKKPAFEPEPGSTFASKSFIPTLCRNLTYNFENASPGDILPIRLVQQTEKRKQYRRGKTAVITSTPHENELKNLKELRKISNPNDTGHKKSAEKKQKTTVAANAENDDDEDTICLCCNDEKHSFHPEVV